VVSPTPIERAARKLSAAVGELRFAEPVTHVYNPLDYAWAPHRAYLRRYGQGTKRVVYLGMNPGPWGMAQTGVPFGEISLVRDWLGIEEKVKAPSVPHPKRPIEGFACTRKEVSGARLWGALAEDYPDPADFFDHAFIANYCPLVFMEQSGKNRTPDKLPAEEREPLQAACDAHLEKLVQIMEPELVIGVGKFAQSRARAVLDSSIAVETILHPSPASPIANRGWAPQARKQIKALGLPGF
jgi:single-strand selective monofunctional uracil DNA glycosylase